RGAAASSAPVSGMVATVAPRAGRTSSLSEDHHQTIVPRSQRMVLLLWIPVGSARRASRILVGRQQEVAARARIQDTRIPRLRPRKCMLPSLPGPVAISATRAKEDQFRTPSLASYAAPRARILVRLLASMWAAERSVKAAVHVVRGLVFKFGGLIAEGTQRRGCSDRMRQLHSYFVSVEFAEICM